MIIASAGLIEYGLRLYKNKTTLVVADARLMHVEAG
jgi:hypothetical protein